MLSPNINRKVLVPSGVKSPITTDVSALPHITATCLCSVLGDKMPLFIILPDLINLPPDLESFAEYGKAFFASSNSGWQTRDTFVYFAICFINWLSQYRKTLDESLRDDEILLILDGHKSRENPLALQLFKENKIAVYVLPSHTSHITQIFDVAIGSPMKSYFTDYFKKLMKNFDPQQNQAAQFRKFVVEAAIAAFDVKCNYVSSKIGAELTSTLPCDPNKLLNSKFVTKLTPQLEKIALEKQKRQRNMLNINNKLITNELILKDIDNYILESKFHKHLSLKAYSSDYKSSFIQLAKKSINKCRMLSRIPDFLD